MFIMALVTLILHWIVNDKNDDSGDSDNNDVDDGGAGDDGA